MSYRIEGLLEAIPALKISEIFPEAGVFLVIRNLGPRLLALTCFILPEVVCQCRFNSGKEGSDSSIGNAPFTNGITLCGKEILDNFNGREDGSWIFSLDDCAVERARDFGCDGFDIKASFGAFDGILGKEGNLAAQVSDKFEQGVRFGELD